MQLCCRLVANAYLMSVTHLTSGMRIGAAAAAEKLDLFPVRGLLPLPYPDVHRSCRSATRLKYGMTHLYLCQTEYWGVIRTCWELRPGK